VHDDTKSLNFHPIIDEEEKASLEGNAMGEEYIHAFESDKEI
jgi:hypothetical protein